MATTAQILKTLPDGSILGIECWSNGYPGWVGKMLLNHYNNQGMVDKLIDCGAISSLGNHLPMTLKEFEKNPTNEEPTRVCSFRDRFNYYQVKYFSSSGILVDRYRYTYLWDRKWWIFDETLTKFVELTEALTTNEDF